MTGRIRDSDLGTRTARYGLGGRPKPYYVLVGPGLHLGYKKPLSGEGKWVIRHDLGDHVYAVETIAIADDYAEADGVAILDFKQAQEKARGSITRSVQAVSQNHSSLTVADAIASYLAYVQTKRKSARDVRYRANAFILPKLGAIRVDALTTEVLRDWINELAAAPARLPKKRGETQRHRWRGHDDESQRRRRATANRVLSVLKAALNRAWRDGYVLSRAAWQDVELFENVDSGCIRCLTADEARRLLDACECGLRNLVQAVLHTGACYSELAQLSVGDFNPDARTIAIRSSRIGKSRHILLTDEAVAFFNGICAGRAGADLIFSKADRIWRKWQRRAMARACAGASISPPITFHDLRHTYAAFSATAGVPFQIVAKNLGHSDMRMVRLHYGVIGAVSIPPGRPRLKDPAFQDLAS